MNFVKLLLTKYIERMGTGIIDMITRCKKVGIPEPEIRIDGGHFVLTLRRKLKSIKTKKKTNDEGFFFLVQDGVQELGILTSKFFLLWPIFRFPVMNW